MNGHEDPKNLLSRMIAAMQRGKGMPADATSFAMNPATGSSLEGKLLGGTFSTLLGMTPGIGESMDLRDLISGIKDEKLLQTALAAVSLVLPMVSFRGAKEAATTAFVPGKRPRRTRAINTNEMD